MPAPIDRSGRVQAPRTEPSKAPESKLQGLERQLADVNRQLGGSTRQWSTAAKGERERLTAQRDSLAAQISTLRGAPAPVASHAPTTPAPVPSHGPSPRAANEQRILGELSQLSIPYTGGGDPAKLGKALVDRTKGRIGTDEPFVYKALELAHAQGTTGLLNSSVGAQLRARDPGIDRKVDLKNHPNDAYLRYLVQNEMSGTEAQRAIDFMEAGKDRADGKAGSYILEGMAKPFDAIGDALHDHPVKTGAAIVGGAVVGAGIAAAAPVVAAGAAIGGLAYAGGKLAVAGYKAATADTKLERSEALVNVGSGITNVAMAAPGAAAATKTISAAAKAAGQAETFTEGAKAFITYGSKLKGAGAAAKAATEATKGPPKDVAELAGDVRAHYGDKIPDTEFAGPPAGKPVLKHVAGEAPISVPNDAIPAAKSYDEGLQAVQKNGIGRYANLTASERAHETAFATTIEKNLPAAVDAHYQASFDKKLDTYIFEVDGAKKLHAGYGVTRGPADAAEASVRATANHALHPTAVTVNRLAFLKRLDELADLPAGDPRRSVFVTNGGCAAGKGSLTDLVKRLQSDVKFGAVWDAAGEGESLENKWILEAAQSRGLKAVFGFAANDPMAGYSSVLARADVSGRIVDPLTFARSYANGTENMKAFMKSPEYLAAQHSGNAEAIGLFTGRFDPRSLKDASIPQYPDFRLLGKDGVINANDLESTPPAREIAQKAFELFDKFAAERAAQGKSIANYFEGAITNTQKWFTGK